MTRICLIAAASLALMMAVSPTPSFAKKVSNDTAAHLLSICLLDGGKTSEPEGNGSYVKCCTKAGSYCIICKQDGSGLCNKTPYRAWRKTVTVPEVPQSGAVAPKQPAGGLVKPATKIRR